MPDPAGMVVAYQADEVRRYEQILRPWGNDETDQVIRIRPHLISGCEPVEEIVG
ncbi:hypothetical protein [Lentzea sp. NPDC051838]|uniref:hypothetical protein n=1 Tax=Lentzea sp. NPDC051838 TaxID=3154849 RepID=UPI003440456A